MAYIDSISAQHEATDLENADSGLTISPVIIKSTTSPSNITLLIENQNVVPTEHELELYASSIGINLATERDLLDIAREGITAPLPIGWVVLQDEEDNVYYYNRESHLSLWEHPMDAVFRDRVAKARMRRSETDRVKEMSQLNMVPLDRLCLDSTLQLESNSIGDILEKRLITCKPDKYSSTEEALIIGECLTPPESYTKTSGLPFLLLSFFEDSDDSITEYKELVPLKNGCSKSKLMRGVPMRDSTTSPTLPEEFGSQFGAAKRRLTRLQSQVSVSIKQSNRVHQDRIIDSHSTLESLAPQQKLHSILRNGSMDRASLMPGYSPSMSSADNTHPSGRLVDSPSGCQFSREADFLDVRRHFSSSQCFRCSGCSNVRPKGSSITSEDVTHARITLDANASLSYFLEERNRIQNKLTYLKLTYKAHELRLASMDSSIQMIYGASNFLHNNVSSTVRRSGYGFRGGPTASFTNSPLTP